MESCEWVGSLDAYSLILSSQGISFGDLVVFDEIMDNLVDIDMALGLYYAAGVSISPG